MSEDFDRCDYCNVHEAIMWLSFGSYGIDEPTGVCMNRECIDKAHVDMIDDADNERQRVEENQ